MPRLVVLAIGAALMLSSAVLLMEEWDRSSLYTAADRPAGSALSIDGLSETTCTPRVRAAFVSITAAGLDAAEQATSEETAGAAVAAERELVRALRCFPSHGEFWTRLALATIKSGGGPTAFNAFFANAELTSPAESTLMRIRLQMLLSLRPGEQWLDDATKPRLLAFLGHAQHVDISAFLDTVSEDRRSALVSLMRTLDTPDIRRWFESHPAVPADAPL